MNETQPQAYEYKHNRLNRMLGKIGLLYGNNGLAEFGLKHAGWGLPLHRRSSLENSSRRALVVLETYEVVQGRPEPVDPLLAE